MNKLIVCLLSIFLTFNSNAQSLEEIISKNIAARGGLEKLNKLNSVIIESTTNAQGMEIPSKVTLLNKKGFRMDMTMMGMDNYLVCNTKEGYNYFPIGGQKAPEPMPADMVKAMIPQFDLQGEFINYKEKGISLTLQGEEDVDGTMCFKILSVMPSKSEKRIFVDKESFQIIKEVEKMSVNGKDMEQASEYSNFQTVDGYVFPFETTGPMGPSKVKKVTVNSEVKESLFELKK